MERLESTALFTHLGDLPEEKDQKKKCLVLGEQLRSCRFDPSQVKALVSQCERNIAAHRKADTEYQHSARVFNRAIAPVVDATTQIAGGATGVFAIEKIGQFLGKVPKTSALFLGVGIGVYVAGKIREAIKEEEREEEIEKKGE